jgi:hypothetical protein
MPQVNVTLVRRDQGDLAGGLDAYRKALAISDRLAPSIRPTRSGRKT